MSDCVCVGVSARFGRDGERVFCDLLRFAETLYKDGWSMRCYTYTSLISPFFGVNGIFSRC